jgi:hypothetical protein
MSPTDPRQASDAALLSEWLEGRVRGGDPRVEELFRRRPEWRELSEMSHGGLEEERAETWRESASETERRFVAECFAEARVRKPILARDIGGRDDVPGPVTHARTRDSSVAKRWPRYLFAMAALLIVSWLARMWWLDQRGPDRKPGQTLGTTVDSIEWVEVAPDFSSFKWKMKSLEPGSHTFNVTIWASGSNGARGEQLLSTPTSGPELKVPLEKRETWPNVVIWRVDPVDSSGSTTVGRELRAERSAH